MIKCGKSLNALYSKMVHVTCAAHALHRVSEEVRNQFGSVDKIVANVKKIFKKAPSRIQIFKNYAPDIPLPPEPIITRWLYNCLHFLIYFLFLRVPYGIQNVSFRMETSFYNVVLH